MGPLLMLNFVEPVSGDSRVPLNTIQRPKSSLATL
jgi:hypothetical protein